MLKIFAKLVCVRKRKVGEGARKPGIQFGVVLFRRPYLLRKHFGEVCVGIKRPVLFQINGIFCKFFWLNGPFSKKIVTGLFILIDVCSRVCTESVDGYNI